jgi:hypothetical protein
MIHKIISGAQYGADQAGLKVALDLGLQTGGMVPKGWITKFGTKPQLSKLGLIEHPTSSKYPGRTRWNAKNSDATLRFAFDFTTAGEECTLRAIEKYEKPYFDINLHEIRTGESLIIFDVVDFLQEHNVEVLNIAGNCGNTKAIAKTIYNITRPALRAYVSAYNNISPNKDVWSIKDL